MVLLSLMLHSLLEYEIDYLLHPPKIKSRFWLRQIPSEAQDGDLEYSPVKLLSEVPPGAAYFHVHTHTQAELCFSGFVFLQYDEIVRLVERKKKSSDCHSSKSSFPRSLPRRPLKPEHQPGFSSGLSRWRSSLSGELAGLLPRCVSPLLK